MAGSLSALGNLQPSSNLVATSTNYISDFDFASQYLPDVYEDEFESFGDRRIASFLRKMSAEIPFASDSIKWTEQGRLHTKYTNITTAASATDGTGVFTVADAGVTACNFRKGQVVFLSANASTDYTQGIITAVSGLTFTVAFYEAGGLPAALVSPAVITAFVYGSEFKKGTNGMEGTLEPEPNIFEVSPVIIKDHFAVNGSDMAQITWVEVGSDEDGWGNAWYLKGKGDTRDRFNDYLEMMMVEHVPAETGSGAIAVTGDYGNKGTKALFESVRQDGNTWSAGVPDSMADFDTLIERLDAQGAIMENSLFLDRAFSLEVDDILAAQNSYGVGGTSYGLFDNDEKMALNLGFVGFRRGSYDFYKSDWKYLNDASTRGGITGGKVNGIMVPAGTKTVNDSNLGEKLKRPFLHVRYREANGENRRLKTWVVGGAGGANNSDLDAMQVHFLSERALCTLGANNFFIFE